MKKIITLLLATTMLFLFTACGEFEWPDSKIASVIPKPTMNKGEINSSSNTYLSLDVEKVTLSDYNDYMQLCIEKGFTIESEESGNSYSAYNKDGYEINLYYYDSSEEMSITATAPEQLGNFEWPTTGLGALVPATKSTVGKISWNNAEDFIVKVGETTKEDYNAYITDCENAGFNLDFSKEDKYYNALNSNGYELTVRYLGFNIIEISIDIPEQDESDDDIASENEYINSSNSESSSEITNIADDVEWRQFLKDYEAWVDDYIALLKKYQENPTDMSILADYTKMAGEVAEWAERADEIELELEDTDAALEYSQELLRIAGKLAEAAY